jgi:hypothetical protein
MGDVISGVLIDMCALCVARGSALAAENRTLQGARRARGVVPVQQAGAV